MAIYHNYDRLISFLSVHHSIRAEKLLLAHGIATVALPTPREIDISCGQCLLFAAVHEEEVVHLLQEHQVQWNKLFKCNRLDRIYEQILK